MGAVLSCAARFYLKAWLVGQLRRESRTGISSSSSLEMAISGEIGRGLTRPDIFHRMNGWKYFTSASTNPAVREARSS